MRITWSFSIFFSASVDEMWFARSWRVPATDRLYCTGWLCYIADIYPCEWPFCRLRCWGTNGCFCLLEVMSRNAIELFTSFFFYNRRNVFVHYFWWGNSAKCSWGRHALLSSTYQNHLFGGCGAVFTCMPIPFTCSMTRFAYLICSIQFRFLTDILYKIQNRVSENMFTELLIMQICFRIENPCLKANVLY